MDKITEAAIRELESGAPLPDLSDFPAPGSALDKKLEAIAERIGVLDVAKIALDRAVKLARDEGASWSHIGMAAGMSRQAAHQRWGS